MENNYNSLEAMLILDLSIKQRLAKLEQIAQEHITDKEDLPSHISKIMHDNAQTDDEIQSFFGQGLIPKPSQTPELHFNYCLNSGVEFCVCITNKKEWVEIL